MATQDPVIYVVADGEKARFLRLEGSQLRTIETFDLHKGSSAEKDVASIKAPHENPREQLKVHFTRDLAAHINKAAQSSAVEGILLVAPPQASHEIREHLDKPTTKKLFKTLVKDLVNTPDHDLLKHLDRPETGWPELASV
ncbi:MULTISPECIES: host attachment protein [Gluconobacter]|uniref:Host attachment protein n=1 Tax=Gluconobacter cadivus TaxID=2728101 RepID=A0ABR9YRI1_9PROT|nr:MULTISPECIES: host attachment protein [Gluconobacter]MBF0887132.1 host attachment protein [Gluconobacter cadivus]MBS1059201.1 host attachment protein [Gluconobacter sp. Dm-44]